MVTSYNIFYEQINPLNDYEASQVLRDLSNAKLEELYCDVVSKKKTFPRAWRHLLNELNRRKDQQIVEELSL